MIAALLAALFAGLPASYVPVGQTPAPCVITVNQQTSTVPSGRVLILGNIAMMCWFGQWNAETP